MTTEGRTMNNPQNEFAWLRLIRDQRWSDGQKRRLLATFISPERIYQQSLLSLTELVGKGQKTGFNDDRARLDADMRWLEKPDHHLITFNHPDYPTLLKELSDPPIALFAIGDLSLLKQPSIAIVGSRRPTPVGAQIASRLASDLSRLGLVITSGMALGIDSVAHRGVLDNCASVDQASVDEVSIGNGATIAVLGCGVDCIYPARHRALYQQISQSGLLLSEYPLGMRATRYSFPQRNRIVSGLSLGVIIVEAAEKSGTLITARLAMEQNREVMVVPGSALSRQYQGSHRLIMQGAALVQESQDVITVLHAELSQSLEQTLHAANSTAKLGREGDALSENTSIFQAERDHLLLRHIGAESTSIDQIISASGLTAAQVSAMLLTLEIEGLIAAVDDGGYLNLS